MTTHSIDITLNEEQQDALLATVEEINTNGGSATQESYLAENGINAVNVRVSHYYNAAMNRLGTAAGVLPYDQRKALIAQIESSIS